MACLSTSPFLWLCGNNAFPLCSPRWWTSDCSQLSATVTGGTEHWCLSNGLSSSFPCLSTYQRAQLSNHVGLLFKLFSSFFKQTFNQPSSFGPFPIYFQRCPQHSWVSRCATIFWLAACVCSSMVSAVLRFNMVGAGSLTYVASGFKTCVSLISFFLALVFICSCFYHFF